MTVKEQKEFIAGNFLTMDNAGLRAATGCCTSFIYRVARERGLRRGDGFRRELLGGIRLSDGQLDWLVKRYANTDNFTLADTLGVSGSTLYRLVRRYGLRKSPAYMRKCQREATAAAKYFRDKNGLNEALRGVYSENLRKGAACQFRRGESNRQRYGDECERRRINNITVVMRELIRRERARIKAGLPQLTRLRLKKTDI